MSQVVREMVLAAALPLLAHDGFGDATLEAAGAQAGITGQRLKEAFPQGPASLVESFSHWADDAMTAAMAKENIPRVRDRVAAAVKTRLEVLIPHKEAARRAAGFLGAPQHAGLAVRLASRSVDAMWRAAGDRSSDFSYYTKRAMLGGVYAATLAYWFSDTSEHHQATWTFLNHRIDDVMKIDKFRGQAGEVLAKLPDPFGILKAFKNPTRR